MKYLNFLIIAIFSLQSFSTELSIGLIEEIYLKSGTNERRVQIYYPYSKYVNNETTFIIMNDGEELFSEDDSWNGKAWNIDETFKDLKIQKENLNLVIIAIDSAKRINGNILDETRRYAEYFPKESIRYIDESFKRSIYSNFIDSRKFNYQDFVINKVIPAIETKFNIRLNKDSGYFKYRLVHWGSGSNSSIRNAPFYETGMYSSGFVSSGVCKKIKKSLF